MKNDFKCLTDLLPQLEVGLVLLRCDLDYKNIEPVCISKVDKQSTIIELQFVNNDYRLGFPAIDFRR